ncbi:hypothetical protein SAY86_010771 [Trapa natans]|uniref:E3 ubiquitin-protein ligase LIN-1 n=1 Tax=Trapa natans TaxID=22666 RepID=A0AAN7LUF9_TRANT|nr:hypothetical protein SAY86_010771 [Trapa natans]
MSPLEPNSDPSGPDSIWAVMGAISKSVHGLVRSPGRWNDLKARCVSLLVETRKGPGFLELSERSVISNLYWAIEGIESAMAAKGRTEDRQSMLQESERMLQVPALLEESGTTSGVPNGFLVCVSYLYLSVVKWLQMDEWQVAMHFLQALLVEPGLLRGVLAPELCQNLFHCETPQGSDLVRGCAEELDAEEEAMRKLARRYRDQLMYYRVMLYSDKLPAQDGYAFSSRGTDCLPEGHSGFPGDGVSKSSFDSSYEMEKGLFRVFNSELMQFSRVHAVNEDDIEEKNCIEDRYCKKEAEFQAMGDEDKPSITTKRRLQDMLQEPQSDSESSSSGYLSLEDAIQESEAKEAKGMRKSKLSEIINEEYQQADRNQLSKKTSPWPLSGSLHHRQSGGDYGISEVNTTSIIPRKLLDPMGDFSSSILKLRDQKQELRLFDQIAATSRRSAPAKRQKNPQGNDCLRECPPKDPHTDLLAIFEKAISRLCFSEGLAKADEEKSVLEITKIYEMLDRKTGVKYTMLKEVILEQLLSAISTSKEERVVRISVSILTTIASGNHLVLQDIKRKGLRLCDLASALKRNIHEAATLIYLIKPTPTEIMTLELLPTLVEVVCSQCHAAKLHKPTPPVASLMIIEVIVTAFDGMANMTHLSVISSPRVLHSLMEVARDSDGEGSIALATIIVKCMQFDGQCRAYISQFTPVAPFLCLLQSKKKRAKFIALEFFHEILCMPRSAAIGLLQRIWKHGRTDLLECLRLCVENLESQHRLFAANLLIQLELLENSPSSRSGLTEAAVRVLLRSMSTEVDQLSSFILSNLGGTFSWTGEPYTIAWLVKKAGLTSPHHRNMIKDVDWEDQSLQDMEVDSWCSKVAKSMILIGRPVFEALGKGLNSKIKQVTRDSLSAAAWLGYEISKSPHDLRHYAGEILIGGLEQFLHPSVDLEERLLACLCIYNYASGKGMQKLIHFSEGVRESLRRLSGISWLAEELHKVADYYLPHKSRISCVHTQILEAGQTYSGPVNALIYYKGLLWSGHSDGSIKVWDIKGQTAALVWDRKEHKKAVTCFSLFDQGERLLSGSSDRTIKVWKMARRQLECVEVMCVNDPIKQLEVHGKTLFIVSQDHGYGIKVLDSSKIVREICKNRKVKCVSVIQGKLYAGCSNSSIQELTSTNYREREVKAASKRWMLQKRPVTSIFAYKDCVYTIGQGVEVSNIKEWRRKYEVQTKISLEKGASVSAVGVVEDFVYLSSSSNPSVLQIWLRATQQKVGRVSVGSKITSLLTANDMVICGTEAGLIKGWIPL